MELPLPELLTQEIVEPEWLVKGLLPRKTVVLWVGQAGAGKSSVCVHLAHAVAMGRPFLELFDVPERARVMYFDEENSHPDLQEYHRRVWVANGCPDPAALNQWLRVHSLTLTLTEQKWEEEFVERIGEFQPSLVIVDTASPAFHIEEENSNSEASRAIQAIRRAGGKIRGAGCTFVILKHEKDRTSHKQPQTVRGAKAWLGAADQVLFHNRAVGRPWGKYHATKLWAWKTRAWGLKGVVRINLRDVEPEWLNLRSVDTVDKSSASWRGLAGQNANVNNQGTLVKGTAFKGTFVESVED